MPHLYNNTDPISMNCLLAIFSLLLLSRISIFAQSDEAEILKLLEAETTYFLDHSLAEVVQQFWVLDEHTRMNIYNEIDKAARTLNKEDMLSMTEIPPSNHATFHKDNHKLYINGNMGFESHDQIVTMQGGYQLISHELRILEKVAGTWKIHISSVQLYNPK